MNRQLIRKSVTVAATVMLVHAAPAAQRSDTEGIKETENFVNAGEKTSRSIGDAKMQIQNALGAYNALVMQPSKDMKGDYKKLLKAVKDMNERFGDARENIANMQKLGETYFAGRSASIKNIQSTDLQQQAQKRLEKNQAAYVGVLQSFQQTGHALEPLRKDLADQITYLGSDLTPSGTASLKPQAEKLNLRGAEVFAKTDQATETANSYFSSLRPTKS